MRFSRDGREYNTDGMIMVETGDSYLPILFFSTEYEEALAVVQTRDGVSARKATVDDLRRLNKKMDNGHLTAYLTRQG